MSVVIHLYDVLRKFKSIHYLNFLSMFRNGKYKLKFMLPKKATKMDEIFTVDLTLCSKCQIDGEDFINFCGLLGKHEL